MKPILVVGSLNMDLVVQAPRHPKPGETILGSGFQTFPGGKGANQAVAAARLGGQVRMVGRVGQDDFGEILLETVSRDGVETTWIKKDPQAATGVALITVDGAGQNTIVVVPGANGQVSPQDVQAAEAAFHQAGVLLLQLEVPLPVIAKAVELAKRDGLQVVLNPAPAAYLETSLLSDVDYLVPNQSELEILTGQSGIEQGVQRLQDLGVGKVIVTLGGDGVLVADGKDRIRLPIYPVQVVDTTAAGDAFVGAFAVALMEGLSTEEAAGWGNAAGALAVTKAGAQASLPTRGALEQLLGKGSESSPSA